MVDNKLLNTEELVHMVCRTLGHKFLVVMVEQTLVEEVVEVHIIMQTIKVEMVVRVL